MTRLARASALALVCVAALAAPHAVHAADPSAPRPAPDLSPGIAFDEARDRFVVFAAGETWEWDGGKWALVAGVQGDDTPSPRHQPTMVYDARRKVVVLFGGESGGEPLSDTWTWDGARWKRLNVESPPGRIGSRGAYDSRRGEVFILGGYGAAGAVREVWVWDGTEWLLRKEPSPPRYLHALTFNARTNRLVTFGGNVDPSDPTPVAATGETWHSVAGAWRIGSTSGPSPRNRAHMACDLERKRVVLFGGATGKGLAEDTWEWDGSVWREIKPAMNPGARSDARMVYDSRRRVVLLFGGVAADGPKNDLWSWNGTAWSRLD